MSRTLTLVIGAPIMLAMATLVLVALPYRELQAEVPPAQLKPYTLAELRGRATYVDKFFRVVLIAPVTEELFSRGWLWTGLRKKWDAAPTIALTSAIRLALHLQNGTGSFLIPVAFILSRARHYGESVRAPIALHMVYNFIILMSPVLWRDLASLRTVP